MHDYLCIVPAPTFLSQLSCLSENFLCLSIEPSNLTQSLQRICVKNVIRRDANKIYTLFHEMKRPLWIEIQNQKSICRQHRSTKNIHRHFILLASSYIYQRDYLNTWVFGEQHVLAGQIVGVGFRYFLFLDRLLTTASIIWENNGGERDWLGVNWCQHPTDAVIVGWVSIFEPLALLSNIQPFTFSSENDKSRVESSHDTSHDWAEKWLKLR